MCCCSYGVMWLFFFIIFLSHLACILWNPPSFAQQQQLYQCSSDNKALGNLVRLTLTFFSYQGKMKKDQMNHTIFFIWDAGFSRTKNNSVPTEHHICTDKSIACFLSSSIPLYGSMLEIVDWLIHILSVAVTCYALINVDWKIINEISCPIVAMNNDDSLIFWCRRNTRTRALPTNNELPLKHNLWI